MGTCGEAAISGIVILQVDSRTKELLWRGTAESIIDPVAPPENIYEIVGKVLENYPPAKKK
jgi:hypothetical protein